MFEDRLFRLFFFILGLIFGSFSNVCIYRIPSGESVIFPNSHCPSCKNPIRFYDNIPILSYILLHGRCRICGKPISTRYIIIELITGIIFLSIFIKYGQLYETISYLILSVSLVIASVIDLDHKIIPDIITLPGIIIGLILSYLFLPIGFKGAIMGLLIGGGSLYLVAVVSKGGMGGGDIKLIAMIGTFIGWEKVLLTIFLGSLLGSIAGIFLILCKKKGRKDLIPFGPFLSMGALASLLFGTEIINWYSRDGLLKLLGLDSLSSLKIYLL